MPSYHVRSSLALPVLPQFPNQEPPRPQQLTFPDLAIMPHLGHTELMVGVVDAGVYVGVYVGIDQNTKMEIRKQWCVYVNISQNTRWKHEISYCSVCESIYLPGVSLGLTFAGLGALRPPVISVSAAAAGTSTILIPSAARSATTGSA